MLANTAQQMCPSQPSVSHDPLRLCRKLLELFFFRLGKLASDIHIQREVLSLNSLQRIFTFASFGAGWDAASVTTGGEETFADKLSQW